MQVREQALLPLASLGTEAVFTQKYMFILGMFFTSEEIFAVFFLIC